MSSPMEGIIFILCSNEDNFHNDGSKYFMRYIIVEGCIIDEPTFEITKNVLERYEGNILNVLGPCSACRKKGVKGPRGYFITDREDGT